MIRTEPYRTREDGVELLRSYSDIGMKIIQDGTEAVYDEAVYPDGLGRTFSETDIPIDAEEATAEEIVDILLGGGEND